MKFLLIYKGDYGLALRGPEMRYISLAKALLKEGHTVQIAAKSYDESAHPPTIAFVRINSPLHIIKAFLYSDCIVLHGGGPFLLSMALLMGLMGKKIILDSYVPHWIELDETINHTGPSPILTIKSSFNALRVMLATLVFDALIVANQRQLDLTRGFMAPLSRTQDFGRIHVIPFGCEPHQAIQRPEGIKLLNSLIIDAPKIQDTDFLVGWLGGTYGWFDLKALLQSLIPAFRTNPHLKLVFFGVSEQQKKQLLNPLPPDIHQSIFFLPWVPFAQRFNYWSAFDLSLVWGSEGHENDYASRTRNFDCLTLGLPILQNHDDEWGRRLQSSKAGSITDEDHLAEDLIRLSQNPEAIRMMRTNIINLTPEFHWDRFAKNMLAITQDPSMSWGRRMIGIVSFIFLLPPVLLFLLYNLATSFTGRRDS